MSIEWNTETEREFHEYFHVPDVQESVQEPQPKKVPNFLWWGIAILACCTFWAMLAVFCWGGNLVPRW